MSEVLLYPALALFAYMVLFFVVATVKTDNSIVDIAWGGGFILVAFVALLVGSHFTARQILLTTLVTIWGLRLSGYIFIRHGIVGEDERYKKWRLEWKHPVLRAFFQVFMLQGVILYIVALPILLSALQADDGLFWPNYIGIIFWVIGFYFEAVGDYQKFRFKTKPENKGRTIMSGLWRYTRHPNYFGEFMMWWGIFFISLGSGWWYVAIISPALLTFLLLKVSGVAMLEEKYEGDAEYAAYKKRTSAFFPLPPKN